MKTILMLGAVALIVAGCASFDQSSGYIATSPQAEAMRTCAMLTDTLTPGISPAAAATLARNALAPSPGAALGDDPAEAMRNCAIMYDFLTD